MSFHCAASRKSIIITKTVNKSNCKPTVGSGYMKPTRIALAVAAAGMISTPAFATNGDNLIGLGAQSRALGGTGTAAYYGSENALSNPSLLAKAQGSEFAIGGTLFMPDVKAETNVASAPGTSASQTSDADTNIIPEVSMSHRINNNWTFGMGMYGTAGMGVDYRDNGGAPDGTGLFNATTNLSLMKFVPALAYNDDRYGFGFAPVIQYGALDINYSAVGSPFAGTGVSDDIGFGANLGAHFDVNPGLTLALAYQSAIDMEYEDQLTNAANGFQVGPGDPFETITSDNLEQPAEIKLGVAYDVNPNWMLTADAKQIQWGSAKGYEDFNWDDQMVYGLGAKYSGNGFWAGFGYNHGEDPIEVLDNSSYSNQAINLFNNHFFPAITESHYTFGGGYSLSKTTTLEGAFVYAPEVDKTIDTGFVSGQADPEATQHEVKHSQTGITVSLRMNF
ncbi:OmpP1/FadL family transporter [Thiohalomonas denitrificans]|uniref:OmpP1/FadL family transporter n=1 Tax=Thiohalomonas denitrificans TaxID=415747 RepID=UPI0026F1449C|nr:outer membrane protein transport protein [Thiohalomonas denitrificans]